jgi:hypothetical protein
MFAALVAVLLACGSEEPTVDEAPVPCPAGCAAPSGAHPVQKARYLRWLSSYPYSQEYYARNGYDFRRERNIPWAVRSSYSLPVDTAASSRRYDDRVDQATPKPKEPQPAPLLPGPRQSKANRSSATASK